MPIGLRTEWQPTPEYLRDQFAMAALTGFIMNVSSFNDIKNHGDAAQAAYESADAMMKERAK